jgi:hypothetical protein
MVRTGSGLECHNAGVPFDSGKLKVYWAGYRYRVPTVISTDKLFKTFKCIVVKICTDVPALWIRGIQIRSDPKLLAGSVSESRKIISDPVPGSSGSKMNWK